MAGDRAAQAAPKKRYNERTKAILNYLESNPLRLTPGTAMVYERDLGSAHLPPVVQGLMPADVAVGTGADPSSHFCIVATALLYVAVGGLDAAHNLVTPLSWGAPTAYGGPPVAGSPAAREAAYAHALVHRSEGHCDGEFGTGFGNANYWYAAAGRHPIHGPLLEAARTAARGDPEMERHVAGHGDKFDPGRFVGLCSTTASGMHGSSGGSGGSGGGGYGAKAFCDAVIVAEWRMLLDYCLERM